MHIMFVHPNFPAQFGLIAGHLSTQLGWPCTFITSVDTTHLTLPFTHASYRLQPGPLPTTFYNPKTMQDVLDHMTALYRGLRDNPQIQPELVVGHMSYGTMLLAKNLYRCPFVGYFEWLPPPFWSDKIIMRPDFPPAEDDRLGLAVGPVFNHVLLQVVDAAYTPTYFQLNSAPLELRHKIEVIHDGIDAGFYKRRTIPRPAEFHGRTIGHQTRVVTFVSPGLESARGFDIFMKTAKRIYQEVPDVVFLIAGEERTNYGHELRHIGAQSFKSYVLSQDDYDLEKFHFLGHIPARDLVTLFSLSDLHIYLTVPFVLSWSLLQAMSSECVVLASATEPVQEAIDAGVHGLLADFYDVDGLARQAVQVLADPGQYQHLASSARERILERYELKLCTDRLVQFFQKVTG